MSYLLINCKIRSFLQKQKMCKNHKIKMSQCIYVLNYIRRDQTYDQLKRNCQTFAADLCGFLAGKKDVKPFHPINKIEYVNRNHLFLYESSKYRSKKKRKRH